MSDNLFESLINTEPLSSVDGEPPTKRQAFHSDHDYIAHKSPSEHSDSGISVVSDDSGLSPKLEKNMTDDQLEYFSSGCSDKGLSPSYTDNSIYDMSDDMNSTKMRAVTSSQSHSVDTTTADLDDYKLSYGNDDDISIDFGMKVHFLHFYNNFFFYKTV